ncbi:MAG: Stk1 family PASTA domain-containing Ser/Thr kinase [Lachnospiraceae bacterium]|nr:Stk1 family PASTA domain-containing Ser/Thr kinase [Lachnospiraceae bacterium]
MLTVGKYIADRYEVLGKIGTGGMSNVYLAMDHILGRRVAIKVLKSEFAEDVNFVTKFRSEAQAAAGLEHANIVNIYDVGSENGMYYIVMEYVEGITLKGYIEKKRVLTYKEAVSIAIQVGKGIEAAHNKNIVHRDIKPQNILISTDGKVKVTDFGIARAVNNNTIHTDVMGSVHYSSPEQARNGYVDGKSDIYSLGIVMYEMVTGRVPYDGDTTVAVAIKHLQEEMPEPRIYAPDLPVSLEGVIKKCTQKNPDRRYEDMGALITDLKRVLETPHEDFVVMDFPGNARTRVIQPEEVESIRKKSATVTYREERIPEPYVEEDDEDEDDEEEGFLNPRMEKAVTILGIVAAIIIVAIIVVIVLSWGGGLKFGGGQDRDTQTEQDQDEDEQLVMIDIRGMTKEEAKEELKKLGIYVGFRETSVPSDKPEGQIVNQSIKEGEEVAQNDTIDIEISSGPASSEDPDELEEVSTPSIVNRTEEEAKRIIEAMGLKPMRGDYTYSDTIEDGKVVSQVPEAGVTAKKGDTVTYVLSRGGEDAEVPNVVNFPEEGARERLTNDGFAVGEVTQEYHSSIPEGHVIRQSVEGGAMRPRGTKIDLVISRGNQSLYYSYSASIPYPAVSDPNTTVEFVSASLRGEDGRDIPIYPSAGGGIVSINATNIENCSSGTLEIYWKKVTTVTDEAGNTSTNEETLPADTRMVTFTRQ